MKPILYKVNRSARGVPSSSWRAIEFMAGCTVSEGDVIEYAYAAPVVTDEMVERAARKVCEITGEDWDSIGEFTRGVLMDTQRAAFTAALEPGK